MPGCYGMEMRRSAECTGTIQPPYYMTWVPNRAANHPSVFPITEKAPTRAFFWLKAATTAFTFKTLLRHYTAKRALTHGK